MTSIYDYHIKSIDGKEMNFADHKGKKILIVNVASECGFTPQYAQLQDLYSEFQDQLTIIACPCNDFGGQEPGDPNTIQSFCAINYGVRFPLTEKVRILGEDPHPLYQWLTQKTKNGKLDAEVTWNFCKFLIDEEGQMIAAFPSSVDPCSDELMDLIQSK